MLLYSGLLLSEDFLLMKFAIQINASPYQSDAGQRGYQFVKTALEMGYEVVRVFFYQEGVYHAFRYMSPPDDEQNISRLWSELAEDYALDLVVCISAAQRRGLLETNEATRQGKHDNDVADGFMIGGLGLWMEAVLVADRFIEFG